MSVSTFDVPRELENRQFVVPAMDHHRYQVGDLENRLTFAGIVGSKLRVVTSTGPIEITVDQLAARPGARFLLRRVSRLNVIAQIQKSLLIAELGKQSGVIEVKLRGPTAKGAHAVLTEICNEYMRQNLARQIEEAESRLLFSTGSCPNCASSWSIRKRSTTPSAIRMAQSMWLKSVCSRPQRPGPGGWNCGNGGRKC
jgi:tyrosine-protein kinase Etk/Wzc